MKTKTLLLLLVAVVLSACKSGPVEWQTFSSSAGGFSVSIPGTFQESTQSVSTQLGAIDLHIFMLGQANSAYMLSYADYPENFVKQSDVNTMLDGARDGALKNVNATLGGTKAISLDGSPGREFTASVPDSKSVPGGGSVQARIYLVKSRLYQLLVLTAKGNETEVDADKFLASFKLQPAK